MWSILKAMGRVFSHMFTGTETVEYPEEKVDPPPRYRGRIVLTRDPHGEERCVACYLCQVVCPVDCISLQATENEHGRRYPESFRINFSRCINCGFCEEACPTYAIQLIPEFEYGEYDRQNMVYEKEHLTISGPGKYPDYDFYEEAGVSTGYRDKGEGAQEESPVDVRSLMP